MSKDVKGHVVEKRYNPAKPTEDHAQLGRAEDEFQLLVEEHDGEQVWVSVAENDYHAVQVGDAFHGGKHRDLSGYRGKRKSRANTDPSEAAARGWVAANTRYNW